MISFQELSIEEIKYLLQVLFRYDSLPQWHMDYLKGLFGWNERNFLWLMQVSIIRYPPFDGEGPRWRKYYPLKLKLVKINIHNHHKKWLTTRKEFGAWGPGANLTLVYYAESEFFPCRTCLQSDTPQVLIRSSKLQSCLFLFFSYWTHLSSSFFLTRGNYWFGSYCATHLPLQIYTLTFWFPNHFLCVWVCLAWICAPKFSHLWVSWLTEILDLQRGENIIPVSPPTPCPVSSLLPTIWHLWAAMPHS